MKYRLLISANRPSECHSYFHVRDEHVLIISEQTFQSEILQLLCSPPLKMTISMSEQSSYGIEVPLNEIRNFLRSYSYFSEWTFQWMAHEMAF